MKFARYHADARQRAYLARARKARDRAWLVMFALVVVTGLAAWMDETYGPTVQANFQNSFEKFETFSDEWEGFDNAIAKIEGWWKH